MACCLLGHFSPSFAKGEVFCRAGDCSSTVWCAALGSALFVGGLNATYFCFSAGSLIKSLVCNFALPFIWEVLCSHFHVPALCVCSDHLAQLSCPSPCDAFKGENSKVQSGWQGWVGIGFISTLELTAPQVGGSSEEVSQQHC